jgi:simple sugar transport system permease protein
MGPFDTSLVLAAVSITTPILFAAIGETIAQRSGVIDIGLEGMVLAGAFFGFWAAWATSSIAIGTVIGLLAGAAFGAIMAFFSITARADQIVVGVGINILAFGATTFANEQIFTQANQVMINPMSPLAIPGLSQIPVVGRAFFHQVPLAYFAYLAVPAAWYLLYRTNWGLAIRGAGEAPDAVETSGLSVTAIRWFATLTAGAMAGLGGAMLSVGNLGLFTENMSGGRGFIALAAVIFGRWRPPAVFGACLLFGGTEALELRLQAQTHIPRQVWVLLLLVPLALLAWQLAKRRRAPVAPASVGFAVFVFGLVLAVVGPIWSIPAQFWLMLPYAVTLVVLAGIVGRTRVPSALGLPYTRAGSGA